MPQRLHSETIAILHRTLLEVERHLDPAADSLPFAILKQIVLQRIAELEFDREPIHQIDSDPAISPPIADNEDRSITDSAA